MKGRPRKPTAVLEATGAYEKHPERRVERENEPEVNGPIGQPPEYFDANHRKVWFELIRKAPAGVLALSDALNLEIATRLTVKMRLAPARMPKWMSMLGKVLKTLGWEAIDIQEMQDAFRSALGINGQELTILRATLSSMGMTPADRSRVHGEKPKPETADPLAAAMQALSRGKQPIQ
jgi:hypothetical protein